MDQSLQPLIVGIAGGREAEVGNQYGFELALLLWRVESAAARPQEMTPGGAFVVKEQEREIKRFAIDPARESRPWDITAELLDVER